MHKEACNTKYCEDFRSALKEITDNEKPVKLSKCGSCDTLVCDLHSTAMVMFRDENDERQQVCHDPAICARCSWINDNEGKYGRPAGWISTRSEVPW